MGQIEGPWSPEEDEMLLNLFRKHGHDWSLTGKSIPGRSDQSCMFRLLSLQRFTPEEDKMLQNLVEKFGPCWSLISMSIPGKLAKTCRLRWETVWKPLQIHEDIENHWNSTLKGKSSSMTNEDITISDINRGQRSSFFANIFIQPPYVSDTNRGQRNSYIHDLNLSLALGGVRDQEPSIGEMARDNVSQPSGGFNRTPTLKNLFPLSGHERQQQELKKIAVLDKQNIYTTVTRETGSQNSIYQGNSSHELGGVIGYQAPSISDMARGNMSSGGTHSYSRDHSAPSWNALYKRDSSPMMIDSDSVQQFVGSEFGRNDFSEVSSKA